MKAEGRRQKAEGGRQKAERGNQKPETRNQNGETRTGKPETRTGKPETSDVVVPREHAPKCSAVLVSGFWFPVSGFWFLADGAIVGTAIKRDADVEQPVVRESVARIVARFRLGGDR
jgi:predicted TIM-barrel enzyme